MRKCIKAFMTKRMVKWYPGMHISTFDYKNLTEKEQSNFVVETEQEVLSVLSSNDVDLDDLDADTNEFQGFDGGSSGGGGADGEY